jgi:hypothetical protein
MKEYYKAVAKGDWSEQSYECFTSGQEWNGFGTPFFELEVALQVAKDCSSDRLESTNVIYDKERDLFILEDAAYAEEDFLLIPPINIEVNGEKIKTYPIGAYEWAWNIEKAPDKKIKIK